MSEEKSCVISFGEEGINVVYAGLWTRRDIERAHYSMVKALPQHILEVRQKTEKEVKSHGRRKQRSREE